MWGYEKKLQYPVKIKNPDPTLAKLVITQLGGADSKRRYPVKLRDTVRKMCWFPG